MKKAILLLPVLAMGAVAQAQDTFVAGWDFDATNGVETVTANWGLQGSQTGSSSATFNWNGTGPSTDFATANPPFSFAAESQFGGSNAAVGNTFLVNDSGTGFNEFSDNFGSTLSHVQFLGNSGGLNSQRAIIQFDGSSFSELVIQFAALNNGVGTVDYTFSTDGVDFFAIESAVSYGSSFEIDTLDLSMLDGASTAFIGIEFNNAASETFSFDNIQIAGNFNAAAVPEPSTFGALAGLLALGAAANRRRRK